MRKTLAAIVLVLGLMVAMVGVAQANLGPALQAVGLARAAVVMCDGQVATHIGTSAGEVIVGTAFDDVIVAGSGNDTIEGLGGDDIVCAGPGVDNISGGDGDDRIYGGRGGDTILGGAGNDWIRGQDGDDEIDGGAGNDRAWGQAGSDTLVGQAGRDRLRGGGGSDVIIGGSAADILSGGTGNDTVRGGSGPDIIKGRSGSDLLFGAGGRDTIFGGSGNDKLVGGTSGDTLAGGTGGDRVYGGGRNDVLMGGAGNDIMRGGNGIDLLDHQSSTVNITVDLVAGTSVSTMGVDSIATIENVTGGSGDDSITGDPLDNIISGGAGTDTLDGGDGTDVADGGPDVDTCLNFETLLNCEINDSPIAVDDELTADEDAVLAANVLADNGAGADSDRNGDVLAVNAVNGDAGLVDVPVTLASGALVQVAPDGVVSYDPNGQFEGLDVGESTTDTFTYTVSDGTASSNTATVTVTIEGANDAPVADDDSVTVGEDDAAAVITATLLAGDTDVDVETLAVNAIDDTATVGTVTLVAGVVSYDPNGQFEGLDVGESTTDTFTYTVSDGTASSNTATVTVTIEGANDAPVADDDSVTVGEDDAAAVITATLLAGDTDVDVETLAVNAIDDTATVGTVTLVAGVVSYDPNGQFEGLDVGESTTDTFTYTVSDGTASSNTATVTVTIEGANDAPVADDDSVTVGEDDAAAVITATLLAGDTDVDVETLAVNAIDDTATVGTVTLVAGVVSYDPNGQFEGLDVGESTTDTFTYTVSDGTASSNTATVTVTIEGANDAPVADDDSVTVGEDDAAAVITATLLAGDTDVDVETLAVNAIDDTATVGTVTLVAGVVSYDPNGQFEGLDVGESTTDTFTYTVSDGTASSNTATVTVTIEGANDAPVADDDSVTVGEDDAAAVITATLLAGDTDVDVETLAVNAIDDTATVGTVTLVAGVVSYDPNGQFEGLDVGESTTDTFTYTVSDGTASSNTATVTVTIEGANDAPVADDDSVTVGEDDAAAVITATLLAGDTDVDVETLAVNAIDDTATVGTVTLVAGVVSYDPNGQFEGLDVGESTTDTFTYTVSDGTASSNTATVTVTIEGADDDPEAADDTYDATEDTPLTIVAPGVLRNDTDIDGETLAVISNTDPLSGTVAVSAGGSFTYDPDADFCGTDSFTYTITDGDGETSTATVTLNVDCLPEADADSVSVEEDAAAADVTAVLLAGDDLGDEPTTITAVSDPANGATTLVAGVVTYQPDADFCGEDTFTYTITDTDGDTSTATVTVTVDCGPDADADSVSVEEDAAAADVTAVLLAGDDLGDEPTTITAVSDPANGATTLVAGVVTYQPDADFCGEDTFTYTITDTDGDTSTATVTVTVDCGPDADADSVSVEEDAAAVDVTAVLLAGDDLGDEPTTITAVSDPANGATTLVAGVVTYQPDADFCGEDTFTYTITDTDGDTSTATVTVTVDCGPDAVADTAGVEEDSSDNPIDVLGNDVDLGDTPTAISAVSDPAHGTAVINDNETGQDPSDDFVGYTPDADFCGEDTFTYTITDTDGDTSTATVTVTVDCGPDADADSVSVEEDAAAVDVTAVLLAGDDLGDEPTTITAVSDPPNGAATLVAGVVTYQPDADFCGEDTFTYTITDTDGDTSTATVTVTVDCGPDAVADTAGVEEDSSDNPIDVLGNDVDLGDTPTAISAVSDPAHGTAVINDNETGQDPSDDFVGYTPDADFCGEDTFTYTITDTDGDTSTATVTVTVDCGPDADADSVSVEEDAAAVDVTAVLLAGDDLGDEPTTITAVSDPANGATTLVAGVVTYQPDADFCGEDTFTYTITDTDGDTSTATVTVTVDCGPDAVADTAGVEEDSSDNPIDVLGNDVDLGDTPTAISAVSDPAHGTAVINDNETGQDPSDDFVDYTPDADFCGEDTFTYTITDTDGDTSTATVTVTVDCGPDADADSVSVEEDAAAADVTAVLLAGDDLGDEPTTITAVSDPANGATTLVAGVVTYQPDADFCGEDTFTYTITDTDGDTSTATVTVTVDCGPDAVADTAGVEEDSSDNPIDVLDNDDQGDTPTAISAVSDPAHGTAVINDNETGQDPSDDFVDYTPDADFCGEDTFTYTITDTDGDTSTATVTVTVDCGPDAVADTAGVEEDSSDNPIDVLDNDDQGDTPTAISAVSDPAHGTAVINDNETGQDPSDDFVDYTPDADFCGEDTFTYTITDTDGDTSTATVTVTVDCGPDAVADTAGVEEDSSDNPIDVLGNDVDLGDTPTAISAVSDPAHGTAVINDNETGQDPSDDFVDYTPDADFCGEDTFTYTITDTDGDTSTATVTVTVDCGPDAVADTAGVEEDSSDNPIDVLGNDVDLGDTPTAISAVSDPAHGTAVINDNETGQDPSDDFVGYTPDADFCGEDTFTYTITDTDGDTSTATVTVTVDCGPDAVADTAGVEEDSSDNPIDVLGNDVDLGDTPTAISAVSDPAHGTAVINDNETGQDPSDDFVDYTPDADFCGEDTFTYTITDTDGDTSTATVTVTVDCGPDAVADTAGVEEDSSDNPIDVLGNDVDLGDTPTAISAVSDPAHGTAVINDNATDQDPSDDFVDYTPDADFCGEDTFTYTITDTDGDTSTATVTVTVNCLPEADADSVSVEEDAAAADVTAVLLAGDDLGDEPTTITAVSDPANGATTLVAGVVTYQPDADFCGEDTFTYTITDTDGDTSTATVTVTVDCGPDAVADTAGVEEDSSDNPIDVLGNDVDLGDTPTAISAVSDPAHGTAVINDNETGQDPSDDFVGYTPDADFCGEDTFTYTITDTDGDTSTATVTVTVECLPDLPVAADDIIEATEDAQATGNVLVDNGNGADYLGDTPTTVTAFDATSVENGTVVVSADGSFTYDPVADFCGEDTFTYTITDVGFDRSTATVTLNVDCLPETVADTAGVEEDSSDNPIDVLDNDDQGDTPTAISAVSDPAHGTAVINDNETGQDPSDDFVDYTPDADFCGEDTFTYTITDTDGDTSTATVTVTVDCGPDAVADTAGVEEDSSDNPIDVLGNDVDLGDTPTAISAVSDPAHGTAVINDNETGQDPSDDFVDYTPDADFCGEDTFTYTITDTDGDTSTATVTVTVDCGPDADADSVSVEEDAAAADVTAVLLAGDDLGDEPTTITAVSDPANGATTLVAGVVTYQPDADFCGEDTFTYTITDTDGDTSTATVTVTVDCGPDAVADTAGVEEDSSDNPIDVLGNDVDLGDTPTAISAVSDPAHGTAVINDNETGQDPSDDFVDYTPDADFCGEDTFTYTITDTDGDTSTATVTVTVNCLPEADADTAGVEEDSSDNPIDVLDNDDQGDTPTAISAVSDPAHGTAVINDNETGQDPSDDFVDYTPDADFCGEDTFTYTITDTDGDTSTATVTVTVDCGPDAVADTAGVEEDSSDNPIDVLGNDVDLGDTPTAISAVSDPAHGTAVINDNATDQDPSDDFVDYTPDADFCGEDTFTYTITDTDGDTSTATVTVTVDCGPDADADSVSVEEDAAAADVTAVLLAGDDLGDEPTTITAVSDPANGATTLVAGVVTYQPDADFCGEDTFTYTITDTDGDTSTATVTVTVECLPDLPVAADDIIEATEDAQATGNVLVDNGNGADYLGDTPTTVTAFDATSVENGTVVVSADGSFTYDPVADFCGEDTFTYTITDVGFDRSTATVTLNVDCLPETVADTAGVEEDSSDNPIDVLDNDDQGDTPTAISAVSDPAHGTAVINDNETGQDPSDDFVDYTPDADFCGEDTFTYTITDTDGDTSTATVTVTVDCGPDAVADTAGVEEDSSDNPIDVLGNDVDLGDTPTAISAVSDPAHGTAVINDNETGQDPSDDFVGYTPDADFCGEDTFTYTITDTDGDTSTATVTVTVDCGPDAVADTAGVEEDSSDNPIDVLDNDDQGDTPTAISAVSDPAHGTAVINDNETGQDPSDDFVDYTPDADFCGEDTFTYTITDTDGDTSTATVTVTVDCGPDAVADTAGVEEDSSDNPIDVLGNDVDLGDTPTAISAVSDPAHGTAVINDNETGQDPSDDFVDYTPDADFCGEDTFTYTITDTDGDTSTATVTVTVDCGPDAVADTAGVEEDSSDNPIDVLDNDDQGDTPTAISAVSDPAHGTAVINDNETGQDPSDDFVDYTPDADFCGEDTFTYTITDTDGDTSTATVTVTVNCLPEAVADTASADEDSSDNPIDVLGNDDQGDQPTSITAVSDPAHGTAVINDNETGQDPSDDFVDYTPDADFCGEDTFTYTITDTDGDTSTATVTVTVNCLPDLPVAADDIIEATEDTQATGNVLVDNGNGADYLGDTPTTVTAFDATSVENGTVVVSADGSFTYDPVADFCGEDTFTYTITDVGFDRSTATVTLNVDCLPEADADSVSVEEDAAAVDVTAVLLAGDDLGDEPTTITAVSDPANGATTLVAGVVTYQPDADFCGEDTFTYTITDTDGDTSTATVTVTVDCGPDAVADTAGVEEDSSDNPIDVLGNDVDLGDTPTAISAVSDPAHGTAVINDNETGQDPSDDFVDYTPDADFCGEDTFTYTITDTDGDTSTATVTVTVECLPDLPVAADDIIEATEDTQATGNVLVDNGNGADYLGDTPTTVTAFDATSVENGTVVVNSDGSFTYDPSTGFCGTADSFTYTITDGDGDTSTATVTLNVICLG